MYNANICRGVFRTKAGKVIEAAKAAGFTVLVNEAKPRKGSFVVTLDGAPKPAIELLNLQRPFTKLRELNLDEVNKATFTKAK